MISLILTARHALRLTFEVQVSARSELPEKMFTEGGWLPDCALG
jgi:hypothetical protein